MTQNLKIFLWAFIISLSSIDIALSAPPETQLGGLYQQFAKNKHLSPVNGLLVLKSGVLANVRFHGNYGPQQPNILCHYQITRPPHGVTPTSDKDCPQDYTTAIVQHLFPSPTGGRLALPGPKYDFFNLLSLTHLNELLLLYHTLNEQNKTFEENYSAFYQLFHTWMLKPTKEGGLLNKDRRDSLVKLWDKSDKDILTKLLRHYAHMFAQSLREIDIYPKHFVESALLAFSWRKAKTSQDLIFDAQDTQITEFSYSEYEQWKQKALSDNHVKEKAFEDLLKNPELLIFVTLAYDLYDNPYPLMLGTGKAFYHQQEEPEPFSDCGESALRNFFNLVLAHPESKTFDSSILKHAFPDASLSLIKFYQDIQPKYADVTDDLKSRSQWANVVSGLNQPEDPLQVLYGNSQGQCNLKGSGGMDNMLAVIEKLLNDKELAKIRLTDQNSNDRRGQMLTHVLTKFSREGSQFSWHVDGSHDSLKNFGDVTITVNGQDLFTWHIAPSHFDFKVIQSEDGDDWRKHSATLVQLLESDLEPSLKGQLLPFYLGSKPQNILLNNRNYQRYTPEIFFGLPLTGGEEMITAIDIALSLNPMIVLNLTFKWLKDLPDVLSINRLVVKLINKHKKIFDPHITSSDSPLTPIFTRIVNSLRRLDDARLFDEMSKYLKIPGFDHLLIEALKDKNSDQIAAIKSKNKETLLHEGCKRGRLPFVEFLVDTAGKQLLDKKNIKAKEGVTPLNLAAAKGHDSIIKLLINHSLTRNIFLNPSNIKDNIGSTPLNLAVRNNRDQIVNLLLDDNDFRSLMLSPDHVRDHVIGYGPLHWAAKNNSSAMIQLLLSNDDVKKVLLDERHWYSNPDFNTNKKMTPIDLTRDSILKSLLRRAKDK